MKITTILQNKMKAFFIAFAVVLLGFFVGSLTTGSNAIPYTGDSTEPSPVPAFNVYTGTPDEGNESDFFKGKVAGDTSASVNNVVSTCETGKQFQLRAYVHNGASQYENGDGNGPSVAKDSKVRVSLPTGEASEFVPNATISSSNASSISDTMTITCSDGRIVTLRYVAGSARQFTVTGGTVPISDTIVTTGAEIGTHSPNGDVWGCWDQRVWVTLIVEVTEKPKELHPAVCDALLTTILANNQVRVNDVDYTARDAQVNSVTLNYGDGNSETVNFNQLPRTHTYANPGEYTIRATLNTVFDGQAQAVTSNACKAKVKIEEKPVVSKKCVITDVAKINRTTYDITATAQVQNTTVQKYVFTTTNSDGEIVDTEEFATSDLSATYRFFQANAGTYTVKAIITTADGVAEGDCETKITVDEEEKEEPIYACEDFTLTRNDRKVTVSFRVVAENGATFKNARIVYSANGTEVSNTLTDKLTSENRVEDMYTFNADARNVMAVATLRFDVNGEHKDVKCSGQAVLGVTTPPVTPPTTLPKTGAGSIAGVFAAVTAAGAIAHRKFTLGRK